MLWKGHSNDGSPHTIDWKLFVDVTADDGTGSLWTLQTRIDAAAYATVMTIDDNGLLTVSGATFTMDQLIVDADNTEAVLIRKDGDAGDVFIVDTVNDAVRMGSDATLLTFGASSDVVFRREAAGIIALVDPGSSIASGTQQEMRIQSFDAVGEERYLQLLADRSGNGEAEIRAVRAGGGGQYDLLFDVTVGALEFWNEGVERWNIQGSVTGDFEFTPQITNRYDLGSAALAVRNVYTNGVLIGQDKTAAYDAITIDAADLVGDGTQDSGAIIWTALGFESATPHDSDWKAFVRANEPDGTDSEWVLQARIDGASFVDEMTLNATTSPTTMHLGPVNAAGAVLRFGTNPAATGTIQLQNVDSVVARNVSNTGDLNLLNFGVSDQWQLGDVNMDLLTVFPDGHWDNRLRVGATVNSSAAFRVVETGGGLVFAVDNIDEIVSLGQDDTILAWGAARDAQMHRGDAADIIEQRRGANPQEWRLYDRFVSHSDYDRLAVYIGGGPPLKTIEFVAETTNASQGISIEIEALPGGSSDGTLALIDGSVRHTITPSSHSFTGGVVNISTPGTSSLTINGFISALGFGVGTSGVGIKMDIAGQGSSDFEDSHKFDMIGAGELANRATWRTFVDVIDVDANSIWTLQDDKNGGGFVTNFSITDDGGFNFPQPLPSHAIGAAIDLSSQLTLRGIYFSLLSGGTIATRFKTADRLTAATGQVDGQFQAWFGGIIRTQTAAESVTNIATVRIDEPDITDALTGGGLITNAQSLLITGAPTEGVNNYALRIVAGDLVVDDSAAILFNLSGTDFSALSIAPTGRLEMGTASLGWTRINIYSDGLTNIESDSGLRIVADDSAALDVRSVTSSETHFIVDTVSDITRVTGQLVVAANVADHAAQIQIQTTFADVATSAGSSVFAAGLIPAGSFLIGVTVRVVTQVTGPTGFDVGDGTDVDRWGNSISVVAGTTTDITDFSSSSVTTFPFANDVRLTSDGVDFTGGSVRITVHYITLVTSD